MSILHFSLGKGTVIIKMCKQFYKKCFTLCLLYSPLFLREHRSLTRARHLTLFCAVPFASFHVGYFLSNSATLVRRQVFRGLNLFRFPCRFYSSASWLHVHLMSTCGRSSPKLFVLSLALLDAAMFVSRAPYCWFFEATKFQRCSSSSYWWTLATSAPNSWSASKFQNHTRASLSHLTQKLSAWSSLLVLWIAILISASQVPVSPF